MDNPYLMVMHGADNDRARRKTACKDAHGGDGVHIVVHGDSYGKKKGDDACIGGKDCIGVCTEEHSY